jgi:hypothetical protein
MVPVSSTGSPAYSSPVYDPTAMVTLSPTLFSLISLSTAPGSAMVETPKFLAPRLNSSLSMWVLSPSLSL